MVNDIKEIKKMIVQHGCHSGHLTSSLGVVELLYSLYTTINFNQKNFKNINDRDMVIISKEHCRLAQICTLSYLGYVDEKLLDGYMREDGKVGHDMYNIVGGEEIAAVDYASGSLGHGLNVGAGLAMAKPEHNIYVVCGDGEFQEGSMWEALLFIKQHNLKNLTVIIDRNYLQIDNYTKNILDTSSNIEKMVQDFGFNVLKCNGHNIDEIKKCLKEQTNEPKCIIADTIKGKGMEFMLEELGFAMFHHSMLSEKDIKRVYEAIVNE